MNANDAATPTETTGPAQTTLVWDLPLRLFHWILVLAVLGAWVTHKIGSAAFSWHKYFGYTALVLTSFRIVWGFVPMFTGRKSTVHLPATARISGSRIILALIVAAACAGVLTWVVQSAPDSSLTVFF